jgi:hypothetical protein
MSRKGSHTSRRGNDVHFTLRWKVPEDGGTFDSRYTFKGSSLDRDKTLGQFRAEMIKRGRKQGYEFLGEVRGSQIRMPAKESEYRVISRKYGYDDNEENRRIRTLYMFNTQTRRVEQWVLSDDYSGFVIEYNGYGFEFVSGAVSEKDIFDEYEQRHIDVLRRLHTPPEDTQKPAELTEQQIFTDGPGFEMFLKTGKVPLPEPLTREELERNTQTIEVAAKNDGGNVIPTAAYYAMNPIGQGEVVMHPATKTQNIKLAHNIVDAVMEGDDPLKQVAENIELGTKYNFDFIETTAKDYATNQRRMVTNLIPRNVEEVIGRLVLEQNNDYPGRGLLGETCLVLDPGIKTRIVDGLTVAEEPPPEGIKSLCGKVVEKYVGLDQYKMVGPPPFTSICGDCINMTLHDNIHEADETKHPYALGLTDVPPREGTIPIVVDDGDRPLMDLLEREGHKSDGYMVDEFMGVMGAIKDGELIPIEKAQEMLEEQYGKEISTPKEERIEEAHNSLKTWVSERIMQPDPTAMAWYFWGQPEDGSEMALGLYYYGTLPFKPLVGGNHKPTVNYILIRTGNRCIYKQGSDYEAGLSHFDNPVSPRSAAELLSFWVDDDPGFIHWWRDDLIWRDQYGDPVPRDLVALPDYQGEANSSDDEEREEHNRIMAAPWYDIDGRTYASFKAMDGEEYDPEYELETAPEDIEGHRIERVTDNLKRYGVEGYYHA